MADDNEEIERAPTLLAGSPLEAAQRKSNLWVGVVAAGVIGVLVALVAMSGDEGEGPAPGGGALSIAECADLQVKFDAAARINDGAEPGSPNFDLSLSRMGQYDLEMRDGGCY